MSNIEMSFLVSVIFLMTVVVDNIARQDVILIRKSADEQQVQPGDGCWL